MTVLLAERASIVNLVPLLQHLLLPKRVVIFAAKVSTALVICQQLTALKVLTTTLKELRRKRIVLHVVQECIVVRPGFQLHLARARKATTALQRPVPMLKLPLKVTKPLVKLSKTQSLLSVH